MLEIHFVREPGPPPASGTWDGMPISLDPGGDRHASAETIFRDCTYTIEFRPRKTRWRYIVARRDRSIPDRRDLEVVGPGDSDAG